MPFSHASGKSQLRYAVTLARIVPTYSRVLVRVAKEFPKESSEVQQQQAVRLRGAPQQFQDIAAHDAIVVRLRKLPDLHLCHFGQGRIVVAAAV